MTSPNLIIYLHVIVNILCHTHENVPALEKKLPPIYFTRDLTQVSLAISKCRKPHNSCEESYNKTKTLVTCLKKKAIMILGEENVMTITRITYSPGLSSATTESGEMQGK